MADERAVLMRAKDYLEALSRAVDPLTGQAVPEDSVLSQPRLQKCFAFVAAYLDREITRACRSEEYYLPDDEARRTLCVGEDVPAATFVKHLHDAALAHGQTPIPARWVNNWLIGLGLLDGYVESVFVERKVLRANDRSGEVGIYEKQGMTPRGELTSTLMFSTETQAWILDKLPEIVRSARQGGAASGHPAGGGENK